MSSASQSSARLRSFRETYRDHYGFVWHVLHRFGVRSHTIEDAVQETFLVAYRRRAAIEGAPIKPWLYGIARRVASNDRRAVSRSERKSEAIRVVQRRTDESVARAYEAVHALDGYLSALPIRDRELFVLSELEGMSGPELADVLGLKLNTVYARVRRLRARFEAHDLNQDVMRLGETYRDRPRATARSWALLVPALGNTPKTLAYWLPTLLSNKLVGATVGACVAAGTLVVTAQLLPETVGAPKIATAQERRGSEVPVDAIAQPQEVSAAEPTFAAEAVGVAPNPPAPPRTPRRPAGASLPSDTNLATQNEHLRRASSALQEGHPEVALQIIELQQRDFPEGPLQDLTAALHIEALCALGRVADARRETDAFLARSSTSPVAPRVRRSCSGDAQKPQVPDTGGA